MNKVTVLFALSVLVLLVACGAAGERKAEDRSELRDLSGSPVVADYTGKAGPDGDRSATKPVPLAVPARAPAATPAPVASAIAQQGATFGFAAADAEKGLKGAPALPGAPPASATALETAQRKIISTASISIEVEKVPVAIAEVRVIAESLGGFVEQLASSGDPERQQATITIRVPQAQFFAALERVEALGKVQGRKVGSEDVSERFIDLKARLQSALREEQSLLSLLAKTQTVTEVLTIERELSRVRSEIERLQGQLNFLERRVELATITVSLSPPREKVAEPPSASLTVAVLDVPATVGSVKALVSSLKGVVDRVFLSGEKGSGRATMSIRVFPADFARALDAVESEGDVRGKELREGAPHNPGEGATLKEPNARIEISLMVQEPSEPPAASLAVGVSKVATAVGNVRTLVSSLNGVVDRVLLSARDNQEKADLSVRVFRADFRQAMEVLETYGKVQTKEVREATTPAGKSVARAKEPDARIDVSFVGEVGSGKGKLIAAIAAPIGGVALAILLGSLFYFTYRAGRRRGSQV